MTRSTRPRLPDQRRRELTPEQRTAAARRLARRAASNRLRRVRLGCHGWRRDPQAMVGDWIWCDGCADLARVAEVAE